VADNVAEEVQPSKETSSLQPASTPTAAATSQRQSPTATPVPRPQATVAIYEDTITLLTYPYRAYQRSVYDPVFDWEFPMLDRAAYEAAKPRPSPKQWRVVVLENEYLRVVVMPDLGGRIYQIVFKPTGHGQLYNNPVLKPSPWGPPQRDGLESGWLAAGGIEWGLPVEEHGYAWGVPWGYITLPQGERDTVTVFEGVQDRLHARVDISLNAGEAALEVNPSIENPTSVPGP
jgi:hypothetical protein